LPLSGIEAMASTTDRTYPKHTHDQYGLGVIDAGGHASLSDRGQVQAGPGDLIFVNPGEVHDGRAVAGRSRTWRMFYIDPFLMDDLLSDIQEGPMHSFAFAGPVFSDEALRRAFDLAFRQATHSSAEIKALELETSILRVAERARMNSTTRPIRSMNSSPSSRRARELIDADPSSPRLTLARLAKEARVSRFQLIRAFARETRLTPHAYILQQRLALARRLIRAGTDIAEASIRAGFFDQSHLTRAFCRQFGLSPGRYSNAEQ
jgi:AraC-like DNA-binding protein